MQTALRRTMCSLETVWCRSSKARWLVLRRMMIPRAEEKLTDEHKVAVCTLYICEFVIALMMALDFGVGSFQVSSRAKFTVYYLRGCPRVQLHFAAAAEVVQAIESSK